MELHELKDFIEKTKSRLEEFSEQLDIDRRRETIEELEKKTYAPTFWDDPEHAQKTIADIKTQRNVIQQFEALEGQLEELGIAHELLDIGEDVEDLEETLGELKKALEDFETNIYLSEPYDEGNAIVEIHPGAGGTESQDWAEMLYRMITRYANDKGYALTVNDHQPADEAGLKSATFTVSGPYAFGHLKAESGVHRLVRISPFDASGRRHTSFAGVNVIPEIDDTIEIDINDGDIKIDTYRSSGAGGQSVNTTDSAVRITHLPTRLTVTCQNERSQIKNRDRAMKILKGKLYQLELAKQKETINNLRNASQGIAFGSQIRSYVMHPYSMVKDHRTEVETGNVQKVLDGDLDAFIRAYLKQQNKA